MRTLKSFLCLLIFVSIASAQSETVVPIATTYYLLGGSQNGKWLTAEAVARQIKEKTKMTLVNLKGAEKGSVFLENTDEEYGACPENKVIKFSPEIESGIAVGDNARWTLVPRVPKQIVATDKTYAKIAADFLRTKRIAMPKINLSQIVQIDLEGDRQNEILITGNFHKKGMGELPSVGDYSFALLRRVVKGRAQNILIEGEFITRRGEYDPPNRREILAVADLNGDGLLEIVLDTAYYEGDWKQVFEVKNGKLVKVLETSCGA